MKDRPKLPTKRTMYERLWEYLKYPKPEFRNAKRSCLPTHHGVLSKDLRVAGYFFDVMASYDPDDEWSGLRIADWRVTSYSPNAQYIDIIGEATE